MKQITLATSSIIIGLLFILGSGSNSDTGETAKTAPTANAGANQTMLLGTTLTLTGSGTDSDGTIIKYE